MRFSVRAAKSLPLMPSKSSLSLSSSSSSSAPEIGVGDVGGKPGGDAVVEEGEAKILMDSANGVFYDEAQVHNRDISIAVLRTSISKRKEEHAIMLSRKGSASEVPCDRPSDYLSDGDCQIQLDSSDYTKGNLREIQEIPASKVQELKAPTVLEGHL